MKYRAVGQAVRPEQPILQGKGPVGPRVAGQANGDSELVRPRAALLGRSCLAQRGREGRQTSRAPAGRVAQDLSLFPDGVRWSR
jgi:hypothetical protein